MFATVLYSFLLCVLNQIAVHRYLQYRQEVDKTFLRPVIASAIMGVIAFGIYQGLYYLCRINIISLAAAVLVSCAVYFILVIRWKAVSEEELCSMPKGQLLIRIAKKTGIMKEKTTKKKRRRPAKKKCVKKRKNKPAKEQDDYWLDE